MCHPLYLTSVKCNIQENS
ncbi:MAG: hypothetical protein K2I71_01890, partial [Helicobacter sp.]|nr:hypothetical protein [Helicobacter sp.]